MLNTKLFSLLISCLLLVTACNNAEENVSAVDSTTTSVDTTTMAPATTDSLAVLDTSIKALPDSATIDTHLPPPDTNHSATNPPATDAAKKSATLGISFYDKMRLHEIKLLSVYVSIENGEATLKRVIRSREEQHNITQEKNDTSVIRTFNINIYERLTVSLDYDTSDFEIKALNGATQTINATGTTRWTWSVKAISTKERSSTITVVLDPQPRSGTEDDLDPVIFRVKIRFSFWDMVRSWIVWLADNPKVTITTILVPAIAWFFARRRKKMRGDEDSDKT